MNSLNAGNHHVFSLEDVANWRRVPPKQAIGEVHASVPSLQRGLVWEPRQIELLWDSIFQGFPIGSLVLAEKIEGQSDKQGSFSFDSNYTTHHILDGQQRCYAIALGFENPWANKVSDDTVLWLDLCPGKRLENSVRKYLFRITTKAHPWGFGHDERSSNLSTQNIKQFLEKHKIEEGKRPLPEASTPFDAKMAVPLGLLFEHFENDSLNWDALGKALLVKDAGFDLSAISEIERDHIVSGVRLALNTKIVGLVVPPHAMRIDCIEQIFQRLNSQGTPLDNEELAYSMIKAYWSDVEKILSDISDEKLLPVTEARLIGMAVRVSLVGKDRDRKLPARLDASRIRRIFGHSDEHDDDRDGSAESERNVDKNRITEYFNSHLKNTLAWIDSQFLYSDAKTYGIPPYLRSSLAWSSPDVFAWLMALAREFNFSPVEEAVARRILGLALSIHWYGIDKARAVQYLMQKRMDLDFSIGELNKDTEKTGNLIHVPVALSVLENEALPFNDNTTDEFYLSWKNFWNGVVNLDKSGKVLGDEEKRVGLGQFVDKLRNNRELLVYAQRRYFYSEFTDFDPSNRLLWKGHNRPWDYDHILPSDDMNARGRGPAAGKYHEICKAWQQSIGNLVAVDFTFNRSAQATQNASAKYGQGSAQAVRLYGNFPEKIDAFNIDLEGTKSLDKPKEFICAARDRMVAMYKDWYNTLLIGSHS